MRGNVLRNRSGANPDTNSFDSPVGVEQRKTAMARMQATTSNSMNNGSSMTTSKAALLEVDGVSGKDEEQNGNEL